MSWFTPKCPHCNGPLEPTGYSAPYPSHRCKSCIGAAQKERRIEELEARISQIENNHSN